MKCKKWKIASITLMLVGFVYNFVNDAVDEKNSEERMKEIAEEVYKKKGS